MSMLTKLKYYPPIWVLFINIEIDGFFPPVGECREGVQGGEVTQVLGRPAIPACINEQPWSTKTCCDSYQRGNVGNLCRGSLFFVSSIC